MNKKSIYTKILESRSEPILFENDNWFVLLALRPCNEGHLLVIPKIQESIFFLLPDDTLAEGFVITTKHSRLLSNIYEPPRVAVFIKGFTQDDHTHIHVTPTYQNTDLDVNPNRQVLSPADMAKLAEKLQLKIQVALA